jgi:uncharacterized protein
MADFHRHPYPILLARLREPRRFMQIVQGPRQVGKTTLVAQVLAALKVPAVSAVADTPAPPDAEWIVSQWDRARSQHDRLAKPVVLVLDEVQKVHRWSEVVKACWDQDTREKRDVRVVLLGSSAFLMQKGLGESLAGRYESIFLGHWSFAEMHAAFGVSLDEYLLYGGYPLGASLRPDETRFKDYVRNALIEPVLSRDVLAQARIEKPALLRRLFVLACEYGGQVLSYNKMLGQLKDATNTTTLADYQRLLEAAWLIVGLPKWSGSRVQQRASSPKWLPLNTALMTGLSTESFEQIRSQGELWGRLVESACGAHLFHECRRLGAELFWWRAGNLEVDYVVKLGHRLLAFEIKSGKANERQSGLEFFSREYKRVETILVGGGGVRLQDFLGKPLS